MKPINLEISAFGPYKDKVEFEFSKLGGNGIFLITGDTGAGKTTIFDAIVYALFGEVSGSNRQVSSIRSDFADNNTETYVMFEFIHKGITYKIKRVPEYTRLKKSGEGTTKNVADASIEWNDNVVSGISNVNEKVEEILGINAKQFKQISLLAQGEFLKILFAESKDRTEIFRKIFDTNIYNNITTLLRIRLRENSDKLCELKNSFTTNAYNIVWNETPDIILKLKSKDLNQIEIKEIIELLEKEIEINKEDASKIDKEVVDYENNIKKEETRIAKVEEENTKIDKYQHLLEIEKELEGKKEYYKNQEITVEQNQKILAIVLPKEQNVKKANLEVLKYEKDLENTKKEAEQLKCEEAKVKEKENKLKELKVILENYQKLKAEFETIKQELKKIEDIQKVSKEKEIAVVKYNKSNLEYQEVSKKYLEEEDKFFKEQAGILAEKLEENKPCPVCGSLEHPHIAQKSETVLSKEGLEELKSKIEAKSKENDKNKQKITEINATLETLINEIKKEEDFDIAKYSKEVREKYEKQEDLIEVENEKAGTIYKVLTGEFLYIDRFSYDEYKAEFENQIKLQCEKITKCNTLIAEYEKTLKEKNAELEKYKLEYKDAYNSLGFETEAEYKEKVLDETTCKDISKEIQEYNKNVIENKTKISELAEAVKDKKIVDLEQDKQQLGEMVKELKTKKQTQIKEKSNLQNNKKIASLLKENAEKLMIQIEKYLNYDELYKTASGTLTGKRRIEFEQYVQATYFDMIIIEANKRLAIMSDNRYLLIRKESSEKIKDKIGLDLDVIDNYNGKKRDVKSLSGGESFKAALALALGVSDVIQSYSGGVVVDTLFIDEGFGSLDMESREQAINTLNLLSDNNKLIGIISHVTELKERIDKKIIIEKSAEGSKVRFEV